ncbi:GNAT family N-acetyltransferase [Methylobacterium sp. J-068]|uniref:GNAT family N-acetyltransferase n=1 Tax=Methylobacterium sp. J-068 TaxID=2836649 RepID=UPI001FB867B5|nr:GNAT family N-acetyltransferase [Methylobacterium sp. J-068]MCJ2036061.1 GNAT family N-acetyltransferase [Methylobacterium sp. J-068]
MNSPGETPLPGEAPGAPAEAVTELQVRAVPGLAGIAAAEWDACATSAETLSGGDETHNPFISHAFLSSLEDSGCVSRKVGWLPLHVAVEREGRLVGVAPCYLKSHSQGEYVFDHGWADAYERAGGSYYPKLQVSVPFTPVTGPRFLIAPGGDVNEAASAIVAGLRALRAETRASSIHVTFMQEREWDQAGALGFLQRVDQQFHWDNADYRTFEDFLGALASRKRKAIRRERRDALGPGITIEHVTGADLTPAHWDAFYAFYADTGARKWGRPYLNRAFFRLLGERMPERVLLVMARREGRYIAGAINLIGDVALYGRNWGCVEDHPFLHFEVCYYQAIDFAIARGLKRVEAGAQGEHKLARGYRPVLMHSAHDIADPALRRAVADYLTREREHVIEAAEVLDTLTPFRREPDAPPAPDLPGPDLPDAAPEATPSGPETPKPKETP